MLSDEEKKAIEGLFYLAHINTYLDLEKEDVIKISRPFIKQWKDETKIVLNLIEKQYKEIEELKNITKSYDSFLGDEKIVIADKKFFVNGYFQENFVRKDKIKAKIEELDKDENASIPDFIEYAKEYATQKLQSLLEKE